MRSHEAVCRRSNAARRQRIIAAIICGLVATNIRAAEHAYRDAATVCVTATVHDYLPGPIYHVIRLEASRIWLRHGIQLTWASGATFRGGTAATGCGTIVALVFDGDRLRTLASGKLDKALARTIFEGRDRTIYVSVSRAFQMTNLAVDPLRDQARDLKGGTFLGRIVAHELGHVLLSTMEHSASGLMKPVLDVRDVLSVDDRDTDLSPAETKRLVARFSLIPIGPSDPLATVASWP